MGSPLPYCRDPQGFSSSSSTAQQLHRVTNCSPCSQSKPAGRQTCGHTAPTPLDSATLPFPQSCPQAIKSLVPFKTGLPLSDWRPFWFLGNDEPAAQPCILHHLVSQEFCQALGSADGGGFLLPVVLQLARHGTVLRDQLKQL